jgi:DNA end-binding protein Ku
MASTVWKGHLTFGLVSIPVRLIRAARAERVKLRQLYRPLTIPQAKEQHAPTVPSSEAPQHPDASEENVGAKMRPAEAQAEVHVAPVRRVFQSAEEDQAIAPADLVKGYEREKGQFVVLEEQELRNLVPQTSSEMQIVEFVRFSEIDPVYLETSYYVVPDNGAERAYALLVEGMRETGYAAIGQLTMHRRDHVVIVRPGKTGIIAHTMFYPDEVRSTEEFRTDKSLVAAKELTMAKLLIEALAQPFDPARFKNTFRERLEQLIQSRIEGQQTTRVESPAAAKVIDIVDALKRSLAQVKSVAEIAERPAPRTERKPVTAEPGRTKTPARSTKAKRR